MSLFAKSRLEPFRKRQCQRCDQTVGVTWRWAGISSVIGLSAPVALAVAMLIGPENFVDAVTWERFGVYAIVATAVGCSLVGGGVQVLVQTLFAPLVKK